MTKRDIYDVRFVTADGPDAYFAKMTPQEVEQLKEALAQYSQNGDITEAEVRLIDENISVSFDQMKEMLETWFGVLEKGRPDASRVDERFDQKTEQMVRDLLVGAFEGGSNYWYRIESKKLPPGSKKEDFRSGGRMQARREDGSEEYYSPMELIPTFPGGQLVIRDVGEGEGEAHVLDLPALKKGWILLKQKHPNVYQRTIDGSWDSADADVFLQLSLFGDVIFG